MSATCRAIFVLNFALNNKGSYAYTTYSDSLEMGCC